MNVLTQASPYTAGGRTFTFDEPCDYFTYGKAKASTLSLSVLVAIEMFNAMNALSEVRSSSWFADLLVLKLHMTHLMLLAGQLLTTDAAIQEPILAAGLCGIIWTSLPDSVCTMAGRYLQHCPIIIQRVALCSASFPTSHID